MGSSDSIQQGRSTFLEELSEASHIIHNCTSRSLVIIDELGRGTSTHDGVAIAYATLHYLLEHKRCMVLFVTHYPKIVDVKNEFPGSVGAYHVSYMMSQRAMDMDTDKTDSKSDKNAQTMDHEDVTYLYKLVPGVSERSFGFKVAQLAQVSCLSLSLSLSLWQNPKANSGQPKNLIKKERESKIFFWESTYQMRWEYFSTEYEDEDEAELKFILLWWLGLFSVWTFWLWEFSCSLTFILTLFELSRWFTLHCSYLLHVFAEPTSWLQNWKQWLSAEWKTVQHKRRYKDHNRASQYNLVAPGQNK